MPQVRAIDPCKHRIEDEENCRSLEYSRAQVIRSIEANERTNQIQYRNDPRARLWLDDQLLYFFGRPLIDLSFDGKY